MLAGTDDHLTWLSPVILNLENMGLTHLESEIRVLISAQSFFFFTNQVSPLQRCIGIMYSGTCNLLSFM